MIYNFFTKSILTTILSVGFLSQVQAVEEEQYLLSGSSSSTHHAQGNGAGVSSVSNNDVAIPTYGGRI